MKQKTTTLPLAACAVVTAALLALSWPGTPESTRSVIVQGNDLESVTRAVREAGGTITHELGIIDAAAAELTPRAIDALTSRNAALRIHEKEEVTVVARDGKTRTKLTDTTREAAAALTDSPGQGFTPYAAAAMLVSADDLHEEGLTGSGSTIAVLDEEPRRIFSFQGSDTDSATGLYNGIAPDAPFVGVRAFDENGQGSYADVIRGLDWIVANKDRFGIRVLNLSFSAPVRSHYWDNPVNQAVMRAWQAGIVVVVSAGNGGPDPMTDSYTVDDPSDDRLASFSATGPTVEGFVKPDILAPGGHLKAPMEREDQIAVDHPEFHDTYDYFAMSGTSQAAAVVSGVAALMLQADPTLSPDDVKCRLMATAHPAVAIEAEETRLADSVFQQGAGLINAYDAVGNPVLGCANRGPDIAGDLAGTEHYAGLARRNADGESYIEGLKGSSSLWNESMLWNETTRSSRPSRYYSWSELMSRVFKIDVLKCPRCRASPMRILAAIHPPAA